jgi:hypothetical protein
MKAFLRGDMMNDNIKKQDNRKPVHFTRVDEITNQYRIL